MSLKMCESRRMHAQGCSSHTNILLGVHSWGLKSHKESYENDKFTSVPCVVYIAPCVNCCREANHYSWICRAPLSFDMSALWYCQLWKLFTCRKGKTSMLGDTHWSWRRALPRERFNEQNFNCFFGFCQDSYWLWITMEPAGITLWKWCIYHYRYT